MPTEGPERRELEAKLQILVDASASLLGSLNVADILPAVLNLAQNLNSPEACAIWRLDSETATWRIAAALGLSESFRKTSVPDSALSQPAGGPIYFEDLDLAPWVADRPALYSAENIRSMVAAPMKIRGKSSGTLTFYYRQMRRFSSAEMRVASALANLAAAAIETAELYRENELNRARTEKARLHASFLAQASAVLASSLDYETTLSAVAGLAVPHIADWCAVDIVQQDGSLKQVALAHTDPKKVERAKELNRRYPPDANALSGPPAVVRTGKPEMQSEMRDRMLRFAARDAEHLELLRAIGFQSYMCLPLTVRNRVLGAITFVSASAARRYGPEDLALAEDLAGRAAIAVDNALLYARAQRERAALQTALTALRENEERLLMALDGASMGIWQWDIVNDEVSWTDNLPSVLGLPAGELGHAFEDFTGLIVSDDRDQFRASLDRAIRQKTGFESEFRTFGSEGASRWIAGKGRAYYDDAGKAVRVIGLATDITERRGLEEKLRASQKLESIGVLAGGVAHDFNNLLTGVMGNTSLALDLLPNQSAAAAPLLENVLRSTERAADLTRQLLEYSGKSRFVAETILLSELVREIANLAQATLPHRVAITLELDGLLPCIEADSSQIQQIVLNLVINAAEAIGNRGGTIRIRTGMQETGQFKAGSFTPDELPPGDYVYLEVQDDGCGMDRETQARIFEPFFSTKFTGRGLGLAAVSGIVRTHHGTIAVSSAPGVGSTFRVLLPAGPAVSASLDPARDLRGSGLILVIDEEEMVRTAAETALCRYGYHVESAANGDEGAAIFERNPDAFAAVVLDLPMAGPGAEALRRIKRRRPDVPVIASRGYNEMEPYRRLPAGDLAAFLQKPYTSAELAQKLKKTLHGGLVH